MVLAGLRHQGLYGVAMGAFGEIGSKDPGMTAFDPNRLNGT
jgi:hypothetical protein